MGVVPAASAFGSCYSKRVLAQRILDLCMRYEDLSFARELVHEMLQIGML